MSVPVTRTLAAMPKVVESAEESSIEGIVVRLKRGPKAIVYQNSTAVKYAKQWLRGHLLIKCAPAPEMISIMEAMGDNLMHDERDVITRLSSERLIWRAYGLERCYEEVSHESDWKRPDDKKAVERDVPLPKWYTKSAANRAAVAD